MTASSQPLATEPTTALNAAFAADVRAGLSANPKHLHSRYFYDDQGSQLFEQIMQLPEYYLTRCETEIFQRHQSVLLHLLRGNAWQLIDLGAGDAAKTRILIEHFYRNGLDFAYVPADISRYALDDLTDRLHREFPALPVTGLAGEYSEALAWIKGQTGRRKFVLFLGSNIGNFSEEECRQFLLRIRGSLSAGDRLLIGFDLRKEAHLIHAAYNDAAGVTAAFNKNLLHRINAELGGQFDPDAFDFHAQYDPVSGFVRSYLISKVAQSVRIEALNQTFSFAPWESIHAENSRKFSLTQIEQLARSCGFRVEKHLFDARKWFTDSIWQVGE